MRATIQTAKEILTLLLALSIYITIVSGLSWGGDLGYKYLAKDHIEQYDAAEQKIQQCMIEHEKLANTKTTNATRIRMRYIEVIISDNYQSLNKDYFNPNVRDFLNYCIAKQE